MGFVENTEAGNILHFQNPNTDRYILDYKTVTKLLEQGIKYY